MVLAATVDDEFEEYTIVFDNADESVIDEEVATEALVYFKTQFAKGGYAAPNVVPAGYFLANNLAYRYLPVVRAIRTRKRFRCDVYGRFGLRYGGIEIRRAAVEMLSARTDFRHEVSLFKYEGGPEKVPYRDYLFEVARAKVCVDLPGAGDLCTRLIDYLAVGSCVVGPPPRNRLPVSLVDGVHLVYCASDLSDLGDVCAELVRDDTERERIARNARDYFDRNLHRRRLATRYLQHIEHACAARVPEAARPRRKAVLGRRAIRLLAATFVVAIGLADLFVVLPEKLGDKPYNALGRDTRPALGKRLPGHPTAHVKLPRLR